MKELICNRCGSNEFYEDGNFYVCKYCGTKFNMSEENRQLSKTIISLNDDVKRLLSRWDENPSDGDKYAKLILQIDPGNERAHRQLNKTTAKSGQGCYIATAVYGSYDCPEVWTLRRYRDYKLAETWFGRFFIRTYYAISPSIVRWFGNAKWFKKMCKDRLDRMVTKLNAEGIEDTPYKDNNW